MNLLPPFHIYGNRKGKYTMRAHIPNASESAIPQQLVGEFDGDQIFCIAYANSCFVFRGFVSSAISFRLLLFEQHLW